MFEIESDKPIPPRRSGVPKSSKWFDTPLPVLEIGQSFSIPLGSTFCDSTEQVRAGVGSFGNYYGKKFSVRILRDEKPAPVVRIWRVK